MCFRPINYCVAFYITVQLCSMNILAVADGCTDYKIEDLIDADFELPAYVNSSSATLLYKHRNIAMGKVDLVLSLVPIDTKKIFKEILFSAEPIENVQQLKISLGDLPDGDYFAYIDCKIQVDYYRASGAGDQSNMNGIERYLRKATISPPAGPSEPIEVSRMSMLFYDDWYLHKCESIERKFWPAEKFPIVSNTVEKDRIMVEGESLSVNPDGSLRAMMWNIERGGRETILGKGEKRYFAFISKDNGETWQIEEEPGKKNLEKSIQELTAEAKDEISWKYYDTQTDGPINLNEVKVIFNAAPLGRPNWGNLKIAAGTGYAVWQKSGTENIVLTHEPLVKQGPPSKQGKWSEVNDNWGGQWFSKDGKTLFFSPARLIPVYPPANVPYDNLYSFRRQMTIWRTHDGIKWEQGYFNTPSEIDGWGYQHYGMNVKSLENGNLYEATIYSYNAGTQQVFLEIAYSRDGIYWERFEGHPPFAKNGASGEFDFGYMQGKRIISSNGYEFLFLDYCNNFPHFVAEVIFYNDLSTLTANWLQTKFEPRQLEKWPYWDEVYGSWEGFSSSLADASATIGILRYRKNGKVSLNPKGSSKGVLITKVLHGASKVSINAKTSKSGKIQIEVLNPDGEEISDYSGSNSAYFSGDDINHTLKWKGNTIENLPNIPFKLRIEMVNADLYALNWQ